MKGSIIRPLFNAIQDLGSGITQTSLVIRSVSSDDVRKYSVIVGNDVAETTSQVEIRKSNTLFIMVISYLNCIQGVVNHTDSYTLAFTCIREIFRHSFLQKEPNNYINQLLFTNGPSSYCYEIKGTSNETSFMRQSFIDHLLLVYPNIFNIL